MASSIAKSDIMSTRHIKQNITELLIGCLLLLYIIKHCNQSRPRPEIPEKAGCCLPNIGINWSKLARAPCRHTYVIEEWCDSWRRTATKTGMEHTTCLRMHMASLLWFCSRFCFYGKQPWQAVCSKLQAIEHSYLIRQIFIDSIDRSNRSIHPMHPINRLIHHLRLSPYMALQQLAIASYTCMLMNIKFI